MRVSVPVDGGGRLVLDLPGLTRAQASVLLIIQRLTTERGFPPTWRDVSMARKCRNANAIARSVQNLREKGYLAAAERDRGGSRAMARSFVLAKPLLWRQEQASL